MNKWLLLLSPVLLSLLVISSFSERSGDFIVNNALLKFNSFNSYSINYSVSVNADLAGSVINYFYNVSKVKCGDSLRVNVLSDRFVISEFFLPSGNYSCINSLGVCVNSIIPSLLDFNYAPVNASFIGSKIVNGFSCNAVSYSFNGFIPSINFNVSDGFVYSCFDSFNGLNVESLISINGLSNDIPASINVLRVVNSFSPYCLNNFTLPYRIISVNDYLLLVNNSLSQGLY